MNLLSELNLSNLQSIGKDRRDEVLKAASVQLTDRFSRTKDFDREVDTVIAEFKELGHDLCMFDTDFDWDDESCYLWCGDWTVPESESDPLVLSFHSKDGVELTWSTWAE